MGEKALRASEGALRSAAKTAYAEGFDSWAGQMNSGADMLHVARTALAEAQRENEALRADRDRLDFIERIYAHVQFRGKLNVWTVDCGLFYPEGIDGPKRELLFDSQDIREAIDRAIREARRGE